MSFRPILFLSVICACAASTAHAEPVGEAATVKNDVTGKLGVQVRPINVGDSLSGNETVRTGNESATQVHFIDDTRLSIGPTSSVVLDRFVVNPNKSAKDAVLNMTTGTLRFVTGNSDPKNFTIKTKVMTLGIRGTDFTIKCERIGPAPNAIKCAIMVTKGVVRICPYDTTAKIGTRFALGNVSCPGGYDLDKTHNFTLVGPNGENSGPQSVPESVIAALNASEFDNAQQVTLASLTSDAVTGAIEDQTGGRPAFDLLGVTPGVSTASGGSSGVINRSQVITPPTVNSPTSPTP